MKDRRFVKQMSDVAVALIAFSLLGASPGPSSSPTAAAPTASPKPACQEPEFRQFDFWIGKWTVRNPNGNEVGSSEISRASEGCAIREQWQARSGKAGMSLNYYDPEERQWHQDWVGGDGTILHLRGGMHGGAMVMSGEAKGPQGAVTNRITWTPLPDRKVKQEWGTSADGGKTWQISFLGTYEPQR
jgi:hypothetical protein